MDVGSVSGFKEVYIPQMTRSNILLKCYTRLQVVFGIPPKIISVDNV